MDRAYRLHGFDFIWDEEKAYANIRKHGIRFEEACEVFFDPFRVWEADTRHHEPRWSLLGYSESDRVLSVVATEKDDEAWRIISARKATKQEKRRYEKEHAFDER